MATKIRTTRSFDKELDRMPDYIALAFQTWVESVELLGIREVRKYKSYHDEPLMAIVADSARLGFQRPTGLSTLKPLKG